MSDGKIIYQLQDLKKFYDQREVLKGITIAFLEGANIGLIGPNGAGKSTLLRILAGEDTEIEGTARPIQGLSIGYLSRSRPSTSRRRSARTSTSAWPRCAPWRRATTRS